MSTNKEEIIIYQTADGKAKIDVRMKGETLWLTQAQMAELKAETQEPMYMRDWLETLDKFSRDFGVGVLEGASSVRHIDAVEKAHREYDAYRASLPDDLSDVEKAYLESLRELQKKLKDGSSGKKEGK